LAGSVRTRPRLGQSRSDLLPIDPVPVGPVSGRPVPVGSGPDWPVPVGPGLDWPIPVGFDPGWAGPGRIWFRLDRLLSDLVPAGPVPVGPGPGWPVPVRSGPGWAGPGRICCRLARCLSDLVPAGAVPVGLFRDGRSRWIRPTGQSRLGLFPAQSVRPVSGWAGPGRPVPLGSGPGWPVPVGPVPVGPGPGWPGSLDSVLVGLVRVGSVSGWAGSCWPGLGRTRSVGCGALQRRGEPGGYRTSRLGAVARHRPVRRPRQRPLPALAGQVQLGRIAGCGSGPVRVRRARGPRRRGAGWLWWWGCLVVGVLGCVGGGVCGGGRCENARHG